MTGYRAWRLVVQYPQQTKSRPQVRYTTTVQQLSVDRKARYSLRIEMLASPTCTRRLHWGAPRRNIAIPFGMEKLRWFGYPIVKTF